MYLDLVSWCLVFHDIIKFDYCERFHLYQIACLFEQDSSFFPLFLEVIVYNNGLTFRGLYSVLIC